ncbi:MAG: MBL fold metallo-hydrolase [Firmicutes bacterium]|nr:MBL fold metallo-hydrolase [Bacillota bacterium]
MVTISERIKFIEAPNKAKFPYCHCLLIEDDRRALIDTSFGPENLQELLKTPIDIIVNTHFHEDHILNNYHFPRAEVWMHTLDAPGSRSLDTFLEYYGFSDFGGDQIGQEFIDSIDLHASPVHRELEDGENLDFGHIQLQVIHTPGHTPGHCVFFEEKTGLLFSSDIDLSGFGPWYAHRCSNIDDFILSIQKCIDLQPQIIVSSHKGIITDDIPARLQRYVEVIYAKEEQIIKALQSPQTIEQLADRQIVYGENNTLTPLLLWFEKMAVAQHLQRLKAHDVVEMNEGLYYLK